jgi:hypothetical protein
VAAGVPVPPGVAGEDWCGQGSGGFAGVRRVDATCDLRTGSEAEGLAILAGVAAVARDAPRTKAQTVYGVLGSVETVYLRGYDGKMILGRWYDKGVESGLAPRGRLIRPEDQRRYPKSHRRGVEELTGEYVREKFQQRWLPLWQATKGGVTVAGYLTIAEKIAAAYESGAVSREMAEKLAGYVVLERTSVRQKRRTNYRRRAKLRELGLVVADGTLEEVEIDLTDVLDEIMEGATWGQG